MKEIERMLRDNGFVLREGKRHRLWEKNGVTFAVHFGPREDWRAIHNARSAIRRANEGRPRGKS